MDRSNRRCAGAFGATELAAFVAIAIAASLAASLAAGCRSIARREGVNERGEELLGHSFEGREIRATVLGSGGQSVLIFAVIHGDEPLGAPLVERFTAELRRRPDLLGGRRVVVIPVLNPDGLARGTRQNARGVDLNRNFAARNFSRSAERGPYPESEPESRILARAIRQFDPRRILAVHAPFHCVNWDGPAGDLARRMASSSGYELRPSIGYPTPGSLGSYAGHDLGLATITLELPGRATLDEVWRDLREALEIFVKG